MGNKNVKVGDNISNRKAELKSVKFSFTHWSSGGFRNFAPSENNLL